MFSGSWAALGAAEVAIFVPVPVDGGHDGARNFIKLFTDAGGGLWLPAWLFCLFEEVKEDRPRMKPSAIFAGIEALHTAFFMDKDVQRLCTERTLDQRFLALKILVQAALAEASERVFRREVLLFSIHRFAFKSGFS